MNENDYRTLALAHAMMFLMGPLFLRSSLGDRFGGVNWPLFITTTAGTFFWMVLIRVSMTELGIVGYGWPFY